MILTLAFLFIPYAWKRANHGFRLSKCYLNWPLEPKWESEIDGEKEIQAILEQPFSYLAKGKQSFVFLSRDGKYVLKLFRYDYEKTAKTRALHSYKLVYDLAKDQTGLIYLHLNPKKNFCPKIKIQDRLKIPHYIDPCRYRFVIQSKCEPFFKSLLSIEAKKRKLLVASFEELIEHLGEAGLRSVDSRLACNFGFFNEKAIAIDAGNFAYDPENAKEENVKFVKRLHRNLSERLN